MHECVHEDGESSVEGRARAYAAYTAILRCAVTTNLARVRMRLCRAHLDSMLDRAWPSSIANNSERSLPHCRLPGGETPDRKFETSEYILISGYERQWSQRLSNWSRNSPVSGLLDHNGPNKVNLQMGIAGLGGVLRYQPHL